MKYPKVVLLSILFYQSLTQDTSVEERRLNMVAKILNQILQDVSEKKTIPVPHVDLGNHGRFENVTVSLPNTTYKTDGVGQFGFQLEMNVSEIIAIGYYDVKDVDVPGLFPISGRGDFFASLKPVNLSLKIEAKQNYETDKFDFFIKTFSVQVVESKLNFENLMDDPYVSEFLNELLGNLVPSLVEIIPEFSNLLMPLLDYYGNGLVNCIRTEITDLENCIKRLFEKFVDGTTNQLV